MIDLADLKVELDIDAGDDSFDAWLLAIEPRAVAYVEMRTHRYFGPEADLTEYIIGLDHPRLYLESNVADEGYLTEVIERQYAGDTGVTITGSASSGFVIRQSARQSFLVRKGGYTWLRDYEYEVTYTRGYATGTEPGEIRQLVIDLIAARFSSREEGGTGIQSETIGGYSYRKGDFTDGELSALGPLATQVIETWMRPVFA